MQGSCVALEALTKGPVREHGVMPHHEMGHFGWQENPGVILSLPW